MIQWLQKLECLDSSSTPDIWKDVSAAYWRYNGESVFEMVKQWDKNNKRLTNYIPDPGNHPLANQVSMFKKIPKGKKKAEGGENLLLILETLIAPESVTSVEMMMDGKTKHPSEGVDDGSASQLKRQKVNPKSDWGKSPYVSFPFNQYKMR